MAVGAGGWEIGARVIRVRRLREIRLVARVTFGGHRLEPARGGAFVAGVALQRRMGSGQRKAVIVILDLLHGDLPTSDGVTLLAIRAQLAAMNIGVAILAALPNVAENGFHVTLGTGNRLMHAKQRISGLIVVEFGHCANGLPCVRSVTVLTGNVEVTVWAMSAVRVLRCRAS
ncbi:MAG: hypothetical protein JOZ80_15220 [Acidobacteriaceae bacterium]|nr:hypothetical protein [Acidobacteriaceae bacterium]